MVEEEEAPAKKESETDGGEAEVEEKAKELEEKQ